MVEIDSELINIAKEYFDYQETDKITNYFQDGRSFLNQNTEKYDFILVDAYKGITPPFELTTIEALNSMKNSLNNNGIVIANVMGAMKGKKSLFLQAEYKTFLKCFDKVILMSEFYESTEVHPNILIGFKNYDENNIDYSNDLFKNIIDDFKANEKIPILTDDYAPVEYYVSKYNI